MKSEFERSPEDLNKHTTPSTPCIGWGPKSAVADSSATPLIGVLGAAKITTQNADATVAMFNRYTKYLDDSEAANKAAQSNWEAMMVSETRQADALERIAKALEGISQALTGVAQAELPNWEARPTLKAYEVTLDTPEPVIDPDHYA